MLIAKVILHRVNGKQTVQALIRHCLLRPVGLST